MAKAHAGVHTSQKPLSPVLDTTFKIGLVLKGLDGILEVAGGVLLLLLWMWITPVSMPVGAVWIVTV